MEIKLKDTCDIVSNACVYDLEEACKASGYPMRTSTDFDEVEDKTLKRCMNLSRAADAHGVGAHDQFLSGIHVSFDLTLSNKARVEVERYVFRPFVSSQGTMHRITKLDVEKQYNKYVDRRIVEIMKEKIKYYNEKLEIRNSPDFPEEKAREYGEYLKELYLEILYSNPAGFMLTARLTTNYRCLKNIWRQRKDHRLPEWRKFCKWIETLPYAKELICYEV